MDGAILKFLAVALCAAGCQDGTAFRSQAEAARSESAALLKESDRLRAAVLDLTERRELLARLLRDKQTGVWSVAWNEQQGVFRPVLREALDSLTLTAEELVVEFNRLNPRPGSPGIALVRVKDGTAYLRVVDGEQLTQRMGSTGAACYLAEATFTLTSLEEIDRVHVGFLEGDHANPGFYARPSFMGLFDLP